MKDAKGMTALHIAAHRGNQWMVDVILEYCPDCCELVDERGWNALHFVVNSSSRWADIGAKYILENSSFSNLLNEKDASGNTPLHHHSKSLHYIADVMYHDRVDKMAFNKQNLSAYDVALTSEELSDIKVKENSTLFHGIFFSDRNYEDIVSFFFSMLHIYFLYIFIKKNQLRYYIKEM